MHCCTPVSAKLTTRVPEDVWTIRFTDMLTSFGLKQRVDQPTHDQNGILDVVITRTNLPSQFIKVTDVGLSDHRLVQWSLELETTTQVYETIFRHVWSFNIDAFKSDLQNSLLCAKSIITSPPHPEEMVKHYNDIITNLLDWLAPIQQVNCRRRKSDNWFDNECYRDANNLMPRNQSAYRQNHSTESVLTKVFSDIMSAIDNGNLVLLSLLDLLATFNCVDHEILINRLCHSFGIQSKVLKWLPSYLTG